MLSLCWHRAKVRIFTKQIYHMKKYFEKVSDFRWNVLVPWFERNENKVVRFLGALTYLLFVDFLFLLTGLLMQILPE